MVEASDEYVLQWEGHAGHVTERFSGLLARQALVDVTLICEEQKLRVHKLVLASCSLYFEEILEQDLGQEPVILLNDLNFHVLKAMVEFMYCGETTISHQYLEPLLHAAKIFKVKELACIAGNMMGPQNAIEDQSRSSMVSLDEDTDETDSANLCLLYGDTESVSTTGCEELVDNKCSTTQENGNSYTESEGDQSLQSDMPNCQMENELEPTLYEESSETEKSEMDWVRNTQTPESLSICTSQRDCSNIELSPPVLEDMSKVVFQNRRAPSQKSRTNEDTCNDFSTKCEERNKLQPLLFEQCCDILSNEAYAKDAQKEADKSSRFSSDFLEAPGKVGKCLKVYTHKRRRSTKRTRNRLMKLTRLLPEPQAESCIDLSDESESPVTLPTSLEMESTEYILSLSTESIVSTIGCIATETEAEISSKERTAHKTVDVSNLKTYSVNVNNEMRQMNDILSDHNKIIAIKRPETLTCQPNSLSRPMLRRSTRLSQQESDDSANNNDLAQDTQAGKDRLADSKKDHSANNSEGLARLKRKTREPVPMPDQCGFDENVVTTSESKSSDAPRALRSSSKFTRNEEKPHFSLNRSGKVEQRTKTGSKLKLSKLMKSDNVEQSTCAPSKLNTIASVSRALWGDMSDFLENRENATEFPDYSPSKEIPFAVGLLPLRAALERMQAMPDYQPRKTRSSVTPLKQELNGVKRKSCSSVADSSGTAKKQSSTGNSSVNGKTFCHVHITTTSQQTARSRRRLLPEQMTTDKPTDVADRR